MAIAAAFLAIASCDKYEDGRPAKNVREEFKFMYPDAWDVEWEFEGMYWEVSFETGNRPNGTEHTALFDKDGNWIQTKTEVFYINVPQFIKDFLAASEYADARMEDHTVDYYQTPNDKNYYEFDIYYGGGEANLIVTTDGQVYLSGMYF